MVRRTGQSGIVILTLCLLPGPLSGQTASAPVASVESRWDDVYCDLMEVSQPADGELQVRYRYRNTGTKPLRLPTLRNFVAQTQLLDLTGRTGVRAAAGRRPQDRRQHDPHPQRFRPVD